MITSRLGFPRTPRHIYQFLNGGFKTGLQARDQNFDTFGNQTENFSMNFFLINKNQLVIFALF
jgi:hypothetical protein